MADVVLKAVKREIRGKQVKALRREGQIPAVLYGKNFKPINVLLPTHETSLTLSKVTSSQLITVVVDGEEHAALVREKQRNPVGGHLLHVDFLVVSLTEKLRAAVGLTLVGESVAVDRGVGVMVTGVETVEVECLPRDLPQSIEVDISNLKEIGDAIYVRDINLSSKVTMLTSLDEMVALITAPAAEEVEEVVAEEEPEVIERGKKEGEEEE
jgi:large subunit ribosomal protein L25